MGTTVETAAAITPQTLTAPVERVESYMRDFIDAQPLPRNLRDAIAYALLAPGKRMRPILVIRACEAAGGTIEQALAPAAAIEMVHCFSLVHDDLPAMDDDDLRRGRPTLHRHTCEAMAILAGDAMTSLAFELLATRIRTPELSNALIRELSRATNDMIAGQVYDTLPDFDAAAAPAERLELIHRSKTGALIRCAVRMGALAGGAGEGPLRALTRYAEAVGLMFQIVDDLLDVTQTTEQLGKTAGKDVLQEKLTYPAVHGLEASRQLVATLRQEAAAALRDLRPAADRLIELSDFLAVRTK